MQYTYQQLTQRLVAKTQIQGLDAQTLPKTGGYRLIDLDTDRTVRYVEHGVSTHV